MVQRNDPVLASVSPSPNLPPGVPPVTGGTVLYLREVYYLNFLNKIPVIIKLV